MDDRWTMVYTTNRVGHPELIKQHLEAHGLDVAIIDKQDSSYHFGQVEIYVRNDDAARAYQLLKEIDR